MAAGAVGVVQRWSLGEPGSPAPPFPARGPGSYSSPSQTAQPARKALPCQHRPQRRCLQPSAAPGGWACCARMVSCTRVAQPQRRKGPSFFSRQPHPPALAFELCLQATQDICHGLVPGVAGQGDAVVPGLFLVLAPMQQQCTAPPRTSPTRSSLAQIFCPHSWPCHPSCCAPASWPASALPGLSPGSSGFGCPHALS